MDIFVITLKSIKALFFQPLFFISFIIFSSFFLFSFSLKFYIFYLQFQNGDEIKIANSSVFLYMIRQKWTQKGEEKSSDCEIMKSMVKLLH